MFIMIIIKIDYNQNGNELDLSIVKMSWYAPIHPNLSGLHLNGARQVNPFINRFIFTC